MMMPDLADACASAAPSYKGAKWCRQTPGGDGLGALREWLPAIVFAACLCFLSFVAGAAVFRLRVFPYNQLNHAFLAAYALKRQLLDYSTPYETSLWFKTRDARVGVVTHDPARVQPGLTLFTSGHAPEVYLMDLEGEIVHTWSLPPSKLLSGSVDPADADPFTYLRKGYLFPNGDLITFFEKVDTTPFGIAIVKVDRDSNIIWSYDAPIHHDFDIGPDGRIYALNTEVVEEPIAGLPRHYFPMLDDEVVVLDADGQEVQRFSFTRAISNSPYQRLLREITQASKGDHLHTNSIELVTEELAASFPFLRAGQVVVSTRHGNLIVAVDLETETAVWAIHGYWLKPHDTDLLPNGHMMLFDNLGHFGPGGASRVLEFDPVTMAVAWQYTGTEEQPLYSDIRSAQERLANGNTLITESDQGRILEVTPDGSIVWDYRNPVRHPDDPLLAPVLSWAQRVDPATFEQSFRDVMGQP
jgi:outer membrane protein assembly factor BamB